MVVTQVTETCKLENHATKCVTIIRCTLIPYTVLRTRFVAEVSVTLHQYLTYT